MNATLNRSYPQPNGVLRALRAMVAAALLLVGSNAALAAVVVSTDRTTMGDWIGTYGSCAYVLPSAKAPPGVEVPILPGSGFCTTATCGADGLPPLTAGGGNYGGGATSDLHDCRGQTSTQGLSDNISYNVRLCSQPAGWESPFAQGYVWTNPFPPFNVDPNGCMMLPGYPTFNQTLEFPTDSRGLASCSPLGQGCTFRTEPNGTAGRIASAWDDLSENKSIPADGAGLCVDVNLSGVPAAQRNLSYKLSGYFLDYDNLQRDLIVKLFDATTNTLLASTPVSSFQTGAYVNFSNLSPLPTNLTLQINRFNATDVNAVISGLFLDRADGASCGISPAITLKKLTNGVDTPSPTDGLAPQIAPGATVTWSYIVTNTGPEALTNVVVNDNKVSPPAICTIPSLAVGASQTCIKTGIAQLIAAGGVTGVCGSVPGKPMYENMGTVTGTGAVSGIPVSANYLSHYCNPPGSFTLTKNPKGATYNIGQNISFTMVVTSTGPGTALNVQLSDPLPTLGNLNNWIISSNPGGCSIAANNLTCNFGDLANGQVRTVTVTTNASGGANASACPGGVTLNNTATVTSTGLPTQFDNGSYTCTPPPPPGVSIIKFTNGADANDPNLAGVPNVAPGATVTWTYRVTNTGTTSPTQAQVVVTDSTTGVTPTFTSVITGNNDGIFQPGEVWLYTATGTALNLTLPPPAGVTTVANSCTASGTQPPRTAYTNVGTVTIPGATATDPSSYCNPPPAPNVTIIKFTNGADANDPNAAGVPQIAPGGTVTWTYRVTNTGNVAVPQAQVSVTDSTTGVTPTFTSVITGDADNIFEPGEVWLYTATGTALNLTLPPPAGVTTVANSCTAGGTIPPSTAYTNIGRVTIPGATATDPSSYCNPPPPPPCPAGSFTFSVDANGNLNMKFDQFPAPNDNSYGANAVGWGTKGHTFGNLTGSDKAGFQIVNPSGVVVLDFNIDYLTATTPSAAFPSGYKSFGPFGGDGDVNVGTLIDQVDITYTSSLANNLNNVNIPGLFSNGVQQIGTGVANVLVDSPPTLDKISNYTLTPAAAAVFTGWDFHDTYFVQLKKAKLVAIGYLNAATNQPNPGWKVQPNLTALHNSPAKPCPPTTGGVCQLDEGEVKIDAKKFEWKLTNSGTADAVLTDVSVSWPAANGNLLKIKLNGDVYVTPTPPTSVTLTAAQLTSDLGKRTIKDGETKTFALEFQNNAATSPYLITLKFGTDASCTVTFDSTNQQPNLAACSDIKPIENMVLEYTGPTAIQNVAFYRASATGVPAAADLMGNTGPLTAGQVFSFGDYDAANAPNDVDFQITFVGGATQKSRFHLSCSDADMNDITDCGKVQGNGKANDIAGGNLWILRDLEGKGSHVCNYP